MLRLGLVGHPVAHSRSPLIQGIFSKSTMIPLQYDLFDVEAPALDGWLTGPARALDGFNVTAPHKEAVWAAMARVGPEGARLSPEAARLGAVNTVRPVEGTWEGHNTDLVGFLSLLGTRRPERALVLGAGGAARAVVAGLADRGIAVTLAARRLEQATALAQALAVAVDVVPFASVPTHLACALVIDCTQAPEVVALPWERLPAWGEVLTLSYGASARPLRTAVAAAGRASTDGLLMLVEQARSAFTHWTGCPVSDLVAQAALEAAQEV